MKIVMAHGSGGSMTSSLIHDVFSKAYGNSYLSQMEDAALVAGHSRLTVTTDSFVVKPLSFPGGDIGRLAVCGTVNDLAMRGAVPKYLTAGFILEEGLEVDLLTEICKSMAEAAKEAGVLIVAGDTKVVEGKGGLFINTAGVGFAWDEACGTEKIKAGDKIILSGTMGDHHAAILSTRLGIDNEIISDVAPLNGISEALHQKGINIHAMRDITRGGLATVLSELAAASGKSMDIYEEAIPVSKSVKSFSGLMGLEPIYMGNEGKMLMIVPAAEAKKALETVKECNYGSNAAIIGEVTSATDGRLTLITEIGGRRNLESLSGEGLPRIC
jgi:hydrogenase expression/formation protein HypE